MGCTFKYRRQWVAQIRIRNEVNVVNIENRLKRLERANRFLLLLIAAMAVALWSVAAGHVSAAQNPQNIVANSIKTHSLSVVNPTGKQAVTIAVGDDGMVSLGMTDVNGKETIGLLTEANGEPSICLAYKGSVCRIVIGEVQRGNQREFSIQLRNADGKPGWMPATANPVAASK